MSDTNQVLKIMDKLMGSHIGFAVNNPDNFA